MSRISNLTQRITRYGKLYNENFSKIERGCTLIGGITGTCAGTYLACKVFEKEYQNKSSDMYIAPLIVPGCAYVGSFIGMLTPCVGPPILFGFLLAGPCMLVKKYKIDNSTITKMQ
jgi:hypothetical protein